MLLKYLTKPPGLLGYRYSCRRALTCSFATSTSFERTIEYEIDLISLKRTAKGQEPVSGEFKFNPFNLAKYESKLINPEIVTKSVNEVMQDPLDYKNYPDYDSKGHLEFIERYGFELQKFLKFIQNTEERKIKGFGQLSSEEILKYLNLFKDCYQKGEVEGVNKYNSTSYNYMFERLHKYLQFDSNFPAFLQGNLSNDFENNKIIMDLYKYGIGKFVRELQSISREYPFGKLSILDITDAIEGTIRQYDKFLQLNEKNVDFGEAFFKGCIQIQRYKNLKSILESLPVKPSHLLYILNNENSKLIISKINDLSGEKENFKNTISRYQAELNLISYIDKGAFDTFPKLATILYKLSINPDDKMTRTISLTLLEQLTPFFTNGTMQDSDLNTIEFETFASANISPILRKNYEFSILTKVELSDFIDELRILRAFNGQKFEEIDASNIMKDLDQLLGSFSGSSVITDKLRVLKLQLATLSRYITWNLSVLDKLVDTPSWIVYFTDVAKSGIIKSIKEIDFSKDSFAVNQYKQIPDDLFLHEFFKELEIVKSKLLGGYDFKLFSPVGIISVLEHTIESIQSGCNISPQITADHTSNLIKLNRKLKKLFQFNGGNTGILDTVILSQSVFEAVASKSNKHDSSEEYTEIPEDIELYKYTKELGLLKRELGTPFNACTSDQVIKFLKESIDDALNEGKLLSFIRIDDVERFVTLEENLHKFFKINKSPAILDTLLHSQAVFEQFENTNHLGATSYKQIPDDLELHKFCKILKIFRDDELKGLYGSYSSEYILSLMNARITEITNSSSNTNLDSRMSNDNVFDFMLLFRKLTKLFDINGKHTEILDTLIQSQSVFDKFEKARKNNAFLYKQIPDNFFLEEYILELIQLRYELGSADFKSHDCTTILNTLKNMMINEKRFNIDKRISYSKLYRNLCYLFKYNGNNSFILDNVLVSGEVFAKFEADKEIEKARNSNSYVSQNAAFVNDYDISLVHLFHQMKLQDISDFVGLDQQVFDKYLSRFLFSKEDNKYQYPVTSDMIGKLKLFNQKIVNYPFFLYSLVQKRSTGEIINGKLAGSVYEESNRKMFENINQNQSKAKLTVPISDSSNKFDLDEFIESDKILSGKYTNSAAVLSSLSKQRSPAEIESNVFDSGKRKYETIVPENEIKDANSVDVGPNKVPSGIENELDTLNNLTDDEVRMTYKSFNPNSTGAKPTSRIDKSSIETFLNNAKKEKDMAKERKFRESKAYEWSKSMYNSNRSLESHNFFDPIVPISKMSKESKELFFPKLNHGEVEFILLTINGQTITTKENPLGKNKLPEDMFTILNRFSEDDLAKFIKNVKKLQKNNWRLIGGGGDKEKMLILTRNTAAKKGTFLARLKSLFATTGAVFLVLVGLNLWLEDNDAGTLAIPESKPVERSDSKPLVESSHSDSNVVVLGNNKESSWKKVLWSTK